MKNTLFLILFLSVTTLATAQQKKASAPAPVVSVKGCHVPSDTSTTNSLSLEVIKAWVDQASLDVKCAGGKMYTLTMFSISIIKQNPMQTLDFGIGNKGFPIMARRTIDQMGPNDTILLRDITGTDATGKESKIATIVFKVAATDTTINPK